MSYSLTERNGSATLTAFLDGAPYTADDQHPNWERIKRAAVEGDLTPAHFDAERAANLAFERLSDRVLVRDGEVYFDGEPTDDALTRRLVRHMRTGLPFDSLVNFYEKVQTNPNDRSREQLYVWLRDHDFAIAEDGDFYAYKGVRDDYGSVHSGPGIVNGVKQRGHLDNSPGNTVEIGRSRVVDDARVGCAFGLHVGTFEYASRWSRGRTVLVKVNPRDVVSVPSDCSAQKVRTCRYTVVEDASEDGREREQAVYSPGSDLSTPAEKVREFTVPSESRPGVNHTLTRYSDGSTSCTCEAYTYGDTDCKHLRRYSV